MPFYILLYNLFLILIALPVLPVAGIYLLFSKKVRAGFFQKLGLFKENFRNRTIARKGNGRPRLWLHAVSVGELNAIRPLIQSLIPDYDILLSTTTRTGQQLARRVYEKTPEVMIFYYPYDFRPVVHRVLQDLKPDLIALTETELWPNFIDIAARRYNIPVILINGRISPRSFRGYQRIRPLTKSMLTALKHLYVQSEGDGERLRQLGAPDDSVTITGNLKFDLHPTVDAGHKTALKQLFNFSEKDTVLVLASTHSGEDEPLAAMYHTLARDFPELKLIIAPRHPERVPEIKNILASHTWPFTVRSQLTREAPNTASTIILDTIGELMTVYSLSNIAIMGGSFIEHGGQNPLEPLSQRIPVIFGPHMFNFPDIKRLILESHAGYSVNDISELEYLVTELITQPQIYSNVVENGQRLLWSNRGTKDKLVEAIHELLPAAQTVSN